jgi:hypothetical protein
MLEAQRVGMRKCWVVEFKPQVENEYLETWWKDFTYRFWVDRRTHLLAKAVATATNKSSPGTKLSLTVNFSDIGERIKLTLPK